MHIRQMQISNPMADSKDESGQAMETSETSCLCLNLKTSLKFE